MNSLNFRLLPLVASLFLIPALYGQETSDKPEKSGDLVAQWRSPALFFLGISAAHIGIFGSTLKPYQTKPIATMRALIAFTKFTLGVILITNSDRIVEQIDNWKKANPIIPVVPENERLNHRMRI